MLYLISCHRKAETEEFEISNLSILVNHYPKDVADKGICQCCQFGIKLQQRL